MDGKYYTVALCDSEAADRPGVFAFEEEAAARRFAERAREVLEQLWDVYEVGGGPLHARYGWAGVSHVWQIREVDEQSDDPHGTRLQDA